jgi:hypothetical protein
MATTLAQVKVTRIEGGNGFLVTCSNCALHAIRPMRLEADEIAIEHRASHNRPNPADQVVA